MGITIVEKKIQGGKKPRSSKQLKEDIAEREQRAYDKVSKKYGDRGRAGQDMIYAENERSRKAQSRDLEFVRQYGKDAPKARGFGTKEYSNPPRKPRT